MSDRAETLCHRAQAGDISAASELVGLFYERIFAYFRRLCGNDDDAADLTQKTFFNQGLSLHETAEVLGIATSTVKYRLREALDLLRAQTEEPKLRPA